MNTFIFTCGDINGIGPEIVLKSLNKLTSTGAKKNKFIFICPGNVFSSTINNISPDFNYNSATSLKTVKLDNQVTILLLPDFNQKFGVATKSSGKAAYLALKTGYSLIKEKKGDCIITAPVSKTAFRMAGINTPGQTELFAKWTGEENFVMTFLSKKINVALLTIHLSLDKVSKSLNQNKLSGTINVICNMLSRDLGIRDPSIAVLGLNPHAGENGLIGNEEQRTIIPVIQKMRKTIKVDGPFPADAFFANKLYKKFNITLGMYHDQALIPFKHINFTKGVNFTAGLPIVRTSPDHGVAYDIAGKFIADESSIIEAYNYAEKILNNRKRFKA